MSVFFDFLQRYWLSVVIILIALGAVWFVYKNRERLMRKPF
jgi:hypothetical protein